MWLWLYLYVVLPYCVVINIFAVSFLWSNSYVCQSVCLTVTRRYYIEWDKRIEVVFGTQSLLGFSYKVLEENSGISKIKCSSFGNFVPNSKLRKISQLYVDRCKCCQLRPTTFASLSHRASTFAYNTMGVRRSASSGSVCGSWNLLRFAMSHLSAIFLSH